MLLAFVNTAWATSMLLAVVNTALKFSWSAGVEAAPPIFLGCLPAFGINLTQSNFLVTSHGAPRWSRSARASVSVKRSSSSYYVWQRIKSVGKVS
jgi:hypothetical protein